jgi:hypothetical protein
MGKVRMLLWFEKMQNLRCGRTFQAEESIDDI